MTKELNNPKQSKILRQSIANRFVHWTTALSVTLLIITGLGQLPLYTRYNVTKLPGALWLGDYFITINLHYLGAFGLLFAAAFHIVYAFARREFDIFPRKGDMKESYQIIKAMFTKGKEPASDKYLAEQRVAYLFIGLSLLLLIVTGLIKTLKNVPGVDLTHSLLYWNTALHNIGTGLIIFGIIGHLAAFLLKENRPLLPGMFTGSINREYVKHRHSLWYAKLLKSGKIIEIELDESITHANGVDFIKQVEKQSDVGKSASM
ncbi:formate dehydrogenase subunit gamma [Desulfosporosinus sp. BICA1-9]|uniref:formate dehydrogenase subunit gamma n=1 Tax=Desulfosporosinus sp. BICA1-9 TaxID=1531958 RepID=UPI00054BBE22|nr:cytochrome b/b6 domain-containing protein [Desulfosporosinus sp. BICA1-9]KJS48623.1 MAG: membrane protein [Peptococcaceae bacterium BRH_c23]KJS89472.1 MAG: membrane protein [Desulfosporosinus sp. BICA1-9]HBW38005.1 cytochrome b/b6 domain-containing protein [Desulfosporosinus sp.]